MNERFEALANKNVLIVDDSIQITSLLFDIFSSCDALVTSANNGRSAMVLVQINDFDLILLDIVMPDPNGWDVLRFIQSLSPHMLEKTILITGHQYNEQTIRYLNNTSAMVIYKPFDVDILRAAACDILLAGERSVSVA